MVYLPAKPAPRMQPSKSFVPYFQFYLTHQDLVIWPFLAAKEAEKKSDLLHECTAVSNKI